MTEFTPEQRQRLTDYLNTHDFPERWDQYTEESACSIEVINLAISGELPDDIPACMSLALGHAVIELQDAMPNHMRNSDRYKQLLPHMAGTGRDREEERANIMIDWMWNTVLPVIQPVADEFGFGLEWSAMCKQKTAASANRVVDAAVIAVGTTASAAAIASFTNDGSDDAVSAKRTADKALTVAYTADRVCTVTCTADVVTRAEFAACAADRAHFAFLGAASYAFWDHLKPIDLLERMTFLPEETA